jgi:peptidoglycan/LPS O-acetylase OafA/YrhL
MASISTPRAALAGALLAAAAGTLTPNNLLAFYLTALAAAVLLFAAFLAYIDAAERPDIPRTISVLAIGLGAALVIADAAVRFPAVLDPSAPGGAGLLPFAALGCVVAGLAADLAHHRLGVDFSGLRRRLRPVREHLSR